MTGTRIVDIVPWAVVSAVGGWIIAVITQWMRSRDRRHISDSSTGLKLEEHRDALTFQLLEAARVELAELKAEVQRLRPMEAHLIHFDEALRHMEALLIASTDAEKRRAELYARAFLNRMRRYQEATGTLRNEAQRLDSKIAVIEREQAESEKRERDDEMGRPQRDD